MREYPQNIDAERNLLGALIIHPDKLAEVSEIITADDFFLPGHSHIYETMLAMYQSNEQISLTLLIAKLSAKRLTEKIGGASYIAELCPIDIAPAFAVAYAEEINKKARARRLIQLCEKTAAKGYACDYEQPDDLINELIAEAFKFTAAKSGYETSNMQEMMLALSADMEKRYNAKDDMIGLSTGFTELDKFLGGLQNGDLITIAGRPSMGKSSFASCIVLNVGKTGKIVVFFSTEVDKLRLSRKFVAQVAMIDSHKFRLPKHLTPAEYSHIVETQNKLSKAGIYCNDKPNPTPSFIRSECLKIQAKTGRVDLVVIDYIGLMEWYGKSENKNQKIGEITKATKMIARELNCPVIILSQLSRNVEQRVDKRPILADLRESGNIEQDSDVVIMLYRDEYYNPNSEKKGIVEVIIRKQREGPTGSVEMAFLQEYTVFKDLSTNS